MELERPRVEKARRSNAGRDASAGADYRADIDGLRAIAVLAVVANHAFPAWCRGGFIGVDIFFVISGYLISTIVVRHIQQHDFTFQAFYARRIRRIFPSLLLVLLASAMAGWFTLLAEDYRRLGSSMAASAAFVANVMFWRETGYFDIDADTKPLLHLWSLGVEEQFYLVWPLSLWLALRYGVNPLTFIVSLVFLSFALGLKGVQADVSATFYLLPTRLWELAIGGLVACVAISRSAVIAAPGDAAGCRRDLRHGGTMALYRTKVLQQLQSVTGLLLIGAGLLLISKDRLFPGAWALLPTLGAGLIISAGPSAWLNSTVLSNRVLVWFGLISYPLYLWHWPLLSFARLYEGQALTRELRIAAIGVAILLAWLTYRFVEKPIRSAARYRSWAPLLVGLVVMLGVVGYAIHALAGIPGREFNMRYAKNAQAFRWPAHKTKTEDCTQYTGLFDISFCVVSIGRAPTVALIGDSHANAIYDFVEARSLARQAGVVMLGQGGCPPFIGVERDRENCASRMNRIVEYLARTTAIEHVVIAGRFAATFEGLNFGGETPPSYYQLTLLRNAAERDRREIFKEGFESMLKALQFAGKRVTVLLDVPELDFDPRACLRTRAEAACSIGRPVVAGRQAAYTALMLELQAVYKFKIIDLKSVLCNDADCQAMAEGRILYRDSHHLGQLGNAYLVRSDLRLE